MLTQVSLVLNALIMLIFQIKQYLLLSILYITYKTSCQNNAIIKVKVKLRYKIDK